MALPAPESLLTTAEVADLLQIHPKQVYRLVRGGLPGRRVGGEWRFLRREVLEWVEAGGSTARPPTPGASPPRSTRAPLPVLAPAADARPAFLAANGDLVVEHLLAAVNANLPVLGFLQADRDQGVRMLQQGTVLAAGSHGKGPPAHLGDVRLARIHLVRRAVGLVARPGRKMPRLAQLGRLSFAARPPSAGVTSLFEEAARAAGLDGKALLARALPMDSHRDVVCAVLRGEADVGLCTHAWAYRVGLAFHALAEESYGLLLRALDLGDPRVVRLCEVAQSESYRRSLAGIPGYDLRDAGDIRYDPEGAN